MPTDASKPLDGINPESVAPDDIDDETLRSALESSNPLVRQRGLQTCRTLVETDVDHVRPVLDEIASLAADKSSVALPATGVLNAVVEDEPDALEADGRLDGLVDAAGSEIVNVQLNAATAFKKLAMERPDLIAPHVEGVLEAVRDTEPDPTPSDYSEVIDDEETRQTIYEHESAERQRRVAGRRTLVNVAVAVAESEPAATSDALDDAERVAALFDDEDAIVAGAAVDFLGELAAEEPTAVAPVRDRLLGCLDHDAVVVRVRTVRALGHLGDDAAVPKLRELAETESDEEIRALASDTADFLADAS